MPQPHFLSFKVTNYSYDEPKTEFKSEDIFYKFEYGWSRWIDPEKLIYWIQLSISMYLEDTLESFSRIITRTNFQLSQEEYDGSVELLEYHADCMVIAMELTQAALLQRQDETKAAGMKMSVVDRSYFLNTHRMLMGIEDSGFIIEIHRKKIGLSSADHAFKDKIIEALKSYRAHKIEISQLPSGWIIQVTYRYDQSLNAWQKIDRLSDTAPDGLSVVLGDVWHEGKIGGPPTGTLKRIMDKELPDFLKPETEERSIREQIQKKSPERKVENEERKKLKQSGVLKGMLEVGTEILKAQNAQDVKRDQAKKRKENDQRKQTR